MNELETRDLLLPSSWKKSKLRVEKIRHMQEVQHKNLKTVCELRQECSFSLLHQFILGHAVV
jgi:hypothetical protein